MQKLCNTQVQAAAVCRLQASSTRAPLRTGNLWRVKGLGPLHHLHFGFSPFAYLASLPALTAYS